MLQTQDEVASVGKLEGASFDLDQSNDCILLLLPYPGLVLGGRACLPSATGRCYHLQRGRILDEVDREDKPAIRSIQQAAASCSDCE